MAKPYSEVRLVNPKPKNKKPPAKKKASTKAKTSMASKKKKTTAVAKRRKSNPAPAKKKRRKSSGDRGRGGMLKVKPDWEGAGYRLLGKAIAAYGVQTWGTPHSAAPGGPSNMFGSNWSLANYGIALASGYIGGSIAKKMLGNKAGEQVLNGAMDLAVSKAFWMQVVGRIPGGRTYLGGQQGMGAIAPQGPQFAQAADGAQEGDTIKTPEGNTFLLQNGQWVSMLGLREVDALGGVETIQPVDALGGYEDIIETSATETPYGNAYA